MDLEKEKETYYTGKVVTMKLEHLIQAYKFNNIEAVVEDMSNNEEKAGTINFDKGIAAAYLLDDEDVVISLKMFINCLARCSFKLDTQLSHVINAVRVIQQTIMLLSNVPQKECNMILEKLGLFDSTFKDGKRISHLDHTYKIEVIDGLLCISIDEIEEE